ncbi:DUF2335 domain-containing protein [Listeria booriae]|uniref:DUF2335 domain-containing protein n=1 Tax=Listeria booriae TaxID=1552123 RepID=UPI00162AEE20|nr:DUF2335 domain-containing protein [Listeria booriae]MBC1943543.1 DUF2335 domain-containing protein [Listeria booriae]MBC6130111.1 DUF2335 domain-containing protein [Listeria booriae]
MSQLDNELADVSCDDITEILDTVQQMPDERQEEVMISLEMHYGPIPHPSILGRYEELNPGAAQLIIENGVAESTHRRSMEKATLHKEVRDRQRSQYLGFIIGIIVIVLGFILILNGHAITGTALSGVTALGLVGSFTGTPAKEADTTDEKNIA